MERDNSATEVFCEGRNVEEALQAACDKLNTTPNQVEYEVIEGGSGGGVLGFLKGRVTKIRVWKKSVAERRLADLLKGFFAVLDLNLDFEIEKVDDAYEIDIRTDGSDGLLIGRGGETLAALQHLISRMASHLDEDLRVRVDVAGYRKRRQDQLRRKARELADRSVASGKEMTTELLPADERRVVHLALGDDPRVETRAVGEGLTKRVMVVPVQGRAGGGERREVAERREGSERRTGRRGSSDGHGGRRAAAPAEAGERSAGRSEDRGGHRGGRPRGPRRPREERPARVTAERERAPEREERERVPEREERERAPEREEAQREPAPASEDSYFRIPESIGIVASPSRKEDATEDKEQGEAGSEQPLTFGRRPRAGRGRRR